MKIIGITGGIGSGKSTVCKIFSTLGIPVFYADVEARKVYDEPAIKKQVIALLGPKAYTGKGLDREFVAQKVFSDSDLLEKLDLIVHPAVALRFSDWCKKNKDAVYVLKEAAILFESGTDKDTSAVITVTAPHELKIKRIEERDDISVEDIEKRIKNQWSDEEKIKRSAFVIKNDEVDPLIPQVLKIHKELSGKTK